MNVYLTSFTLPSQGEQEDALAQAVNRRTCYSNYYPFQIFQSQEKEKLTFAPITLLYGSNGSGKSTLLNLIGDKLDLERRSPYNRAAFFRDFVKLCQCEGAQRVPLGSEVLTSDDVFDDLLDLRCLNDGIDLARGELLREYRALREGNFQMKSLDDYDQLKRVVAAKRKSGSAFVRQEVGVNVRGKSNGETAFRYFTNRITESRLYLLDEPENSLSVSYQRELAKFLEDSARFYRCQFVVATHSPFLLAMKGAAVYDLDQSPLAQRPWQKLPAVQAWYAFFRDHRAELALEEEGGDPWI